MVYQELIDKFNKLDSIYLYGAGVVAYGAYKAIQELFGIKVNGFLVTDKDNQLERIDDIPIHAFKEMQIGNDNLIMIATPEEYHDSIEQALQKQGILNYIKLDSHMEYVLMGKYMKKVCGLKLIEDYQTYEIDTFTSIGIYKVVSHMDRKLIRAYREASWIKEIQVGTVLTKERLADITDERCGSLSEQNALYGELSATYYAWKYGIYDVTGIFHYRRILKVTGEQMQLLKDRKIDVILPLPFVCYPDASGQYRRYLLQADIDIMLEVIKERDREHFKEILDILKIPYLYNYNMLIARKEVFDDYCSWLFPILKETAYRCEMQREKRLSRYIGRIGEVLTSLYFMQNMKKWKIAHAEKIWRV